MDPDVVHIPLPIHRLPFIFEKKLKKTRNSTLQHNDSKSQGSKMGNSSLHIKTDNVGSGTKLSSKVSLGKKKSGASESFGRDLSNSSKPMFDCAVPFPRFVKITAGCAVPFPRFVKITAGNHVSSEATNSSFSKSQQKGLQTCGSGGKTLNQTHTKSPQLMTHSRVKSTILSSKKSSSSSSFHSNFNGHNGSLHLLDIESGNQCFKSSQNIDATHEHVLDEPSVLKSTRAGCDGAAVVSSGLTITDEPENETLRKLRSFKQFDAVTDTSDHYFSKNNSSMKQNPKSWAKKIQEEWKILEKHLPDTIFVRIYESRMDLMRVVIIGPEGTPYHDGLFFFDVYFPPGYPNEPPLVHYHSRGLRLNPNLYASGKVCLSLLNTWSGHQNQKWTPGVSTMLQVLVSIQGLILNEKPYFNEPGNELMRGLEYVEKKALQYNEDTFILSVRTMTYMIRSPPKNFEDLVVGHFYSRAYDILGSCIAYMEGFQVGCFLKGGVQNVNDGKGNCSAKFKAGLVEYVNILVKEFERIGLQFVDEGKGNFLSKFKDEFERIGVQNVDEGKRNCSPKFKASLTLGFWLFVCFFFFLFLFCLLSGF